MTLSVERGKPLGIQFSDARPFTKIVEWGIESKTVCEYVLQNTLEAIGFIPYQTRKHKLPRSHPAPLKPPYILGERAGDSPFSARALRLNYLIGCSKSPPASQARDGHAKRDRRDPKFGVRGSKFRKPRTSDLEPSRVSPFPPVSHVSRDYPAGVCSSCPRRTAL